MYTDKTHNPDEAVLPSIFVVGSKTLYILLDLTPVFYPAMSIDCRLVCQISCPYYMIGETELQHADCPICYLTCFLGFDDLWKGS